MRPSESRWLSTRAAAILRTRMATNLREVPKEEIRRESEQIQVWTDQRMRVRSRSSSSNVRRTPDRITFELRSEATSSEQIC